MSENTEQKTPSIKRDWMIAGGGALGFFGILKAAGWIDDKFDFSAIFNLVDFYVVAAKVAIASALAWTVQKFVFSNTLGKDFGETFDIGWTDMSNIEKTRWILSAFIVIFLAIIFNF